MTGDCFHPKEWEGNVVFFPLWHTEYFTRTWAPIWSLCKDKVVSFSAHFHSHQTQQHRTLTWSCHRGTFSSRFKQILELWLDFPLVLRQSTSVGIKQVIGTSPGPVWWRRATCQYPQLPRSPPPPLWPITLLSPICRKQLKTLLKAQIHFRN